MVNRYLIAIASRVSHHNCISAEDVNELQRKVFMHGLICRNDVERLAALDRHVSTADPLWAKFFVRSVVEFVVWTSRPTGYVNQETARWLVSVLMPGGIATVNANRVVLEIVREAQQVDAALLGTPRNATRAAAVQHVA
jgi:hypothetical protein